MSLRVRKTVLPNGAMKVMVSDKAVDKVYYIYPSSHRELLSPSPGEWTPTYLVSGPILGMMDRTEIFWDLNAAISRAVSLGNDVIKNEIVYRDGVRDMENLKDRAMLEAMQNIAEVVIDSITSD